MIFTKKIPPKHLKGHHLFFLQTLNPYWLSLHYHNLYYLSEIKNIICVCPTRLAGWYKINPVE